MFFYENQEFKEFIEEVQDAVGQHLDENHIASFADLSPSERLLFIDRASKTIQSGM